MNKIVVLFLLSAFSFTSKAVDLTSFINRSDTFFQKYVANGKVAYKTIKSNQSEIQNLYQDINTMDISKAGSEEKKAFYINAYNLIVIYQVSKYYPLKSPLDQSGFFDKVKHQVAGEPMTLNSLEIKKLILEYKDPRIHFVLACAAVSCPPLANFAYTPSKLESLLTVRTKSALNDPNWLRVNKVEKKVEVSKLFEWYKKDFSMNEANSILDFINKYRSSPIPSNYVISHYEYNWALNES